MMWDRVKQSRKKFFIIFVLSSLFLMPLVTGELLPQAAAKAESEKVISVENRESGNRAAMIQVQANFSTGNINSVRKLIDKALKQDFQTIIFRFTGHGSSLEGFSELAREIARLKSKKGIHTVAYLPKDALGMTMAGILACQEIVADEFAQQGQVYSPMIQGKARKYDEQSLVNKMVGFARAGGHDPLLAEAMTRAQMFLYEIGLDGQRKLVDQKGYEKFVQRGQPAWRMIRQIVGSDELLLLDGREAKKLGLVSHLAGDENELAEQLNAQIVEMTLTTETEKKEGLSRKDFRTKIIPDPNQLSRTKAAGKTKLPKVVVIICEDMIDDGLYESIKRRTEIALAEGATTIIYQIDTFGGLVKSAESIWSYLIHEVGDRARTVAYIPTKAISAGAMISVACNDIIMKESTKIGDCAPIIMGGKLKGTEREKQESFLRSYFKSAAEKNGYPVALCISMVTMGIEVYQVKNNTTGKNEYFTDKELPALDPYRYDLENQKLIVKADELLTLTANEALEYGMTRVVVEDREEAIAFLEKRDGVVFPRPVTEIRTNWSEELVRWLTSPTVSGILLLIAMLGLYIELNSPGIGLPGGVALIAFIVMFGSKYLIGLAEWWEIGVFFIGMILLAMEIFVIPGFGVAGISGILLIMFALVAMAAPGEIPIPATEFEWNLFEQNLLGMLGGVIGFMIAAYFLGRYMERIPLANRLVLAKPEGMDSVAAREGMNPAPAPTPPVKVGEEGVSLSQLRPAGRAKFGIHRVDVVTKGLLVEADRKIIVVAIEGNSIVVKEK